MATYRAKRKKGDNLTIARPHRHPWNGFLRLRQLAAEIAEADAHVVGLQEAALYRTQSPGDFMEGNPELATDVAVDFLALLLQELDALGVSYREVSTVIGTDVEMVYGTGDDIRLTDRDVILARTDVRVTGADAGNYDINLTVPIGGEEGPPITLRRGWASADVIFDGTPIRSAGDGSTTDTYGMMMQAGYRDAWKEAGGDEADGYTCCHDDDLRNATAAFNRRIDFILIGGSGPGAITSVDAAAVGGADSDKRTASDLWPSDHAGVVSTLRISNQSTAVVSASWGVVKAAVRESD